MDKPQQAATRIDPFLCELVMRSVGNGVYVGCTRMPKRDAESRRNGRSGPGVEGDAASRAPQGRNTMITEAALTDLRATFRGDLITPTDAGYDDVRRIHNGMFVRRPALIARCLGTADVAEAVRFARTHDLELAVRGGGHS